MAFGQLLVVLAGLLAVTPSQTLAVAAELSTSNSSVVPGGYIIEFHDNQDTSSFFDHVDPVATTRTTFGYSLFKGVSIQFDDLGLAESNVAHLNSLPSVKSIWPLRLYPVPKHEVVSVGVPSNATAPPARSSKRADPTDIYAPHVMTQIDKLHDQGYTGAGIKIGVVDTGVDYNHPLLGGCFGSGCLISYGTDLVGDNYNGLNTPVPDSDPLDSCQGHGTHVSAIIASQANSYGFIGAAPDVTLGMYRVFGCSGNTGDDVLIHAFILAFEAGSDIITASVGSSSGWSEQPWAVVVSRIVEAGTPCTVSAGNDGNDGLFSASTASDGKGVTSVASFDSDSNPFVISLGYDTLDGGSQQIFQYVIVDTNGPIDWSGVNLPLWALTYDTSVTDDGCNAFPSNTPDLSGYVVLLRRGGCTFAAKAANANSYGAKYTTDTQGAQWVSQLQAGGIVRVNFDSGLPSIPSNPQNTASAGQVSTFTSWGPTFEMDIKPQFGAVGGHILSTYPVALGSYAVLSGTSMACPMIAGIIALMKNVRGKMAPATINDLLSSNSNPQLLYPSRGMNLLAPVPQQGAGLVQAYDTAFATTLLSVSSLAFNDTAHLEVLDFIITNQGSSSQTYSLYAVSAATAYTFSTVIVPDSFSAMQIDDLAAVISLSTSFLSLNPGESATVVVSAIPPVGVNPAQLPIYSGCIAINGSQGDSLSLPYQGAAGSLYSTSLLVGTYVSQTADPGHNSVPAGFGFALSKTVDVSNYPISVVFFAFGTALLNVEAIRVTTCKGKTVNVNLGSIADLPSTYNHRNPAGDSYEWSFSGRLADGTFIPKGTYMFKVSALRIFGNPSNPGDFESTTTNQFSVTYVP